MTLPAAHGIVLSYNGGTVRLRPTLRAAITLERLHDGFAGLFRQLRDFNMTTITAVIEVAATDHGQVRSLRATVENAPLKGFYQSAQAPLAAFCQALIPTPRKADETAPVPAKPMPWAEVYRELYRIATGWLQWPPETAWNATPDEITEAFDGLLAKLKAIHGAADEDRDDRTQEKRDRNLAAGLDPEFDREGLRALKAKITEGRPR
ncbi:hypothetical protein R5H32_05640 [Defluviimonas sp. D31]|uniref:hypothetical protein n=1 Tax=Defluviimonas sp. D31 TaxID=3083253 RepID=UPI00296EAC0E|nr:hypothetical protein [Defluviimonas sp. D31]MDW4548831.1 hypothetical protein [Defluviimonas sp. D31]